MSLTGHLRDKDSPVRAWFLENLGNAPAVRPWNRSAATTPEFTPARRDASVHANQWRLRVPASDRSVVNPSTLGTAFDQRLRLLLSPDVRTLRLETTAVGLGAALLARHHRDRADWAQLTDAQALALLPVHPPGYLEADLRLRSLVTTTPMGRTAAARRERDLAAICWVLALYEQIYRAGIDPAWPLVAAGPYLTLDDLLALVPEQGVADLVALTRAFAATQPGLAAARRIDVGPTFTLTAALGGADADLVADGRLLDVKTMSHPDLDRVHLWQLAGYVLADQSDRYRIREVGFYFARHGQQLHWPVRDYLCALAGRRVTLTGMRREFAALLDDVAAEEARVRAEYRSRLEARAEELRRRRKAMPGEPSSRSAAPTAKV